MHREQKFLAIISLINKYFWKTKFVPLMSILLPLAVMIIYFFVDNTSDAVDGLPPTLFVASLPSFISLSILPFLLMTLPQMHSDFKNSILLRRIKISNISKIEYLFLLYTFAATMSLVFVIITFLIFLAFGNSTLFEPVGSNQLSFMQNIDWLGVVYGILMLLISGISIGFFIGMISPNSLAAQMIGLGVFMISLVLGGQIIPLFLMSGIDNIFIATLPSPLNYSLGILNTAIIPTFQGGINNFTIIENNAFNLETFRVNGLPSDNPGLVLSIVYDGWQKMLNLIVPWFIFALFTGFNYRFFKWSRR